MNIRHCIMAGVAAAGVTAIAIPSGANAHDHRAARSQTCQPVTQAQVESQFARFNGAWATGNPDTVTQLFARDAVLLPTVSNRPRTDHAGIRDYFVGFLRGQPVGEIKTSTVKLGCNTASRLGTWSVTMNGANGARNTVHGRYSFIYRYVDGDWKIDHLHSSLNPETQTAAAAH